MRITKGAPAYFINDLKLLNNSTAKYIKTLKTFLHWATERGYNTNNSFEKFKAQEKDGDIIYLTEAELLKHCQLAVQTDDLAEYHRLRTLYHSNKLTDEERESLIQLNELIEIAHAKRMSYVLQLANLRNISLEKAMHDLGIKHLSE